MKVEDVIENYLLSLGQKISLENYNFIPKQDYNYKNIMKEEKIKIGNYTVELNQINLNSKKLKNVLSSSRTNFNDRVPISEDVTVSCKNIVNNAITYFTDFLKYTYNNFDLNIETVEKFVTLCNGSIDSLGRNIQSTLSEYDIKMAQAQREGASRAQRSLESSYAEINSKKSTYVTLDTYHDPIMGDRVSGYVSQGFSDKAFHEGMLAGAQQAAAIIASVPVEVANKEAVEGLKKLRDKTIADFNDNFLDLLSAKIKNMIDIDIVSKTGKDLNENPTIYNHYYSIINELKEEDLENFKKATEFYGFDFKEKATEEALENIINHYKNNNSFDYKGGDALLAIYLHNNEYIFAESLSERILGIIKNRIQPVKKEKIDTILTSSLENIETCKYLKEENIKNLKQNSKELANKTIANKAKEQKNNLIVLLLNIVSSLLLILVAVLCFIIIYKFWYIIGDNTMLVIFGIPAIVIGIIALFFSNFKHKNKIIKLALIIASTAISIYGVNSINKVNTFREGKILVKYKLNNNRYEWVKIGTPIDLSMPEEKIGDETAQGWTNKEGKFYINEIIATENIELHFSTAMGAIDNGLATVTFKLDNGQPDFVYKQYIGSWIQVPQDPIKEGYTFVGWVTGKNKTPVIHKQTKAEKNITITASYKKAS